MKAVQRPILVHQIHCLSASILNLLERTRYEHIHAWLTVGDASTRIQPSQWHSINLGILQPKIRVRLLFHFFEILSNGTCVYGQLPMGTQYTQIAALWHACPPKENPKPLEKRPENQNPSPTPR